MEHVNDKSEPSTRIYAGTPNAKNIKAVMLDGRDVTKFAQWADAINGEVGIYPNDGEKMLLTSPPGLVIGHRGTVEIIFEEGK